MINKQLSIFLACLTLLLISCSESPQPKKLESNDTQILTQLVPNTCKVNMGWDPWAPYQYLTPDNEVRGLEIDLITAIAKGADCDIQLVQKSWFKLLNDIKNGNIDLLAGATRTKSREEFAYFSENYRHESFIMYIRSGEAEKFSGKSLQQLLEQNFKLGVTVSYIYGDQISQLQDKPDFNQNFVYVPTTEVNYYNLLQNKIDGFLEDPFVAAFTIKSKGLQGQIETSPIEIHSGDVAMMFSKKSVQPETVEAFNKSLAQLKASGEYKKILAKYSQ